MGLVRKANVDDVAAGKDNEVDAATMIRQAVTAEIERQRLAKLAAETNREADRPGDDG